MNIITLVISGFIALLMLLFFISLLAAITMNMKSAQKYRQKVALAVNRLRLNKMLSALGIDLQQYLHTTNLVEVHNHMTQCSSCQHNEQCDEELTSGTVSIETVHFCNNKKHLRDLVLEQQSST